MQQRFETGSAPHIDITACQGSLVIAGWKRSAVEVSGEGYSAEMAELDQVVASCEGDLELKVPTGSSLTLAEVHGPIKLRHLDGHVTITLGRGKITLNDVTSVKIMEALDGVHGQNINGPLTVEVARSGIQLRNIADLQVTRAEGDIAVQFARGFVSLGEVSGELDLHTISGDVTVRHGKGEVNLSNLGGGVSLPSIEGDIRLNGGLANGEHELASDGTILVRWPADAPLSLAARAPQVVCSLWLQDRHDSADQNGGIILTGHIEEGKPHLRLSAKQRIGIKPVFGLSQVTFDTADFDFDFEAMAQAGTYQEPAGTNMETVPQLPATEQGQLATVLAAEIEKGLREAGIQLPVADLDQIVAGALAAAMADPADQATLERQVDVAPAPPSSGLQKAKKARQATEHSLRHAEESIEKARQTGGPKEASTAETRQSPSPETEPAQEPGSKQDEQLHILNLLKDGLLSVDQANLLLRALAEQ